MADVTNSEDLDALRHHLSVDADNVDIDALLAGAAQAIEFSAFEKAVDILSAVVVLAPESARAWAYLGTAHHELGHREEATRAYRRALTLDEEDFSTALSLAALYAERGEADPARALLNWLLLECEDDEAIARAIELKRSLQKPQRDAE